MQMIVNLCQSRLDRCRLVDYEDAVLQVIECRAAERLYERHQEFPPRKGLSVFSDLSTVSQRPREFLIPKLLTCKKRPVLEILRCYRKLTHRRERDTFQLSCRELCLGVERADRVDRVAKEFDPHRRFCVR